MYGPARGIFWSHTSIDVVLLLSEPSTRQTRKQRSFTQIIIRGDVSSAPSAVEKGVPFNGKENHHFCGFGSWCGSSSMTLLVNTGKRGGLKSLGIQCA